MRSRYVLTMYILIILMFRVRGALVFCQMFWNMSSSNVGQNDVLRHTSPIRTVTVEKEPFFLEMSFFNHQFSGGYVRGTCKILTWNFRRTRNCCMLVNHLWSLVPSPAWLYIGCVFVRVSYRPAMGR